VFRITKPTSADVEREVELYSGVGLKLEFLASRGGLQVPKLPVGFAHDLSRSTIGTGRERFQAAVRAFEEWKQFELRWVRVANPGALIQPGQIVAVEVQAIGLFSLNLSHIVDVIRDDRTFGFIYKTTPHHAEEGEERFLLTFDPDTDEVHYELEAVSRPQHWLARLGYPVTRAFQHRFADGSHKRMSAAI
jgi:uncharacterized protein (UPF0548 family)